MMGLKFSELALAARDERVRKSAGCVGGERNGMTLEELRKQIDLLDQQLVELLSERARAAQMIGHLKAATQLPVYEPAREKVIYANVRAHNKGPLPDIELTHIYERIIDVMRALQRDELASQRNAQVLETPETGNKQ